MDGWRPGRFLRGNPAIQGLARIASGMNMMIMMTLRFLLIIFRESKLTLHLFHDEGADTSADMSAL